MRPKKESRDGYYTRQRQLCFICLTSSTSTFTSESSCQGKGNRNENGNDGAAKGGNATNEGKYDSTSAVKLLLSYILQSSSGKESGEMEMEEFKNNIILSVFEKGRSSICVECLRNADNLMGLHLELEKVQMQILDVLRHLQDCLRHRKPFIGKDGDDPDIHLSRFQNTWVQEFIGREFSDKAQVRLERLNIAGYNSSSSFPEQFCKNGRRSLETSGDDGGDGHHFPKIEVEEGRSHGDDTSERKPGEAKWSSEKEVVEAEDLPRLRVRSKRKASYSIGDKPGLSDSDLDYNNQNEVCNSEDEDYFPERHVSLDNLTLDCEMDMNSKSDRLKRKRGRPRKEKEPSLQFKNEDGDDGDEDYCPDNDYVELNDEDLDCEMNVKFKTSKSNKKRGRPRLEEKPKKEYSLLWDCDICLENIPFKEMETHLKTHPEFEKYYKCDICPGKARNRPKRIYGTYKGLVWHHLRCSHFVQMPCILCPDQSIMFLRGHLCKHLYEFHYPSHRKLQCEVESCSEEFCDPISLKDHRWRKHSETYACEVCGKTFKAKKYLLNHLRRNHAQQEPFYCTTCPRQFKYKSDLRTHEINVHERELVQCPKCPKILPGNVLKYHFKGVHGEKQLQCQFCDKTFSMSGKLRVHEEAHRAEKKYKCSECSYAGTTRDYLQNHMRVHREKTFKCQNCPKAFSLKTYLESHQLVHTKEQPFKCDMCEAAFRYRSMRAAHRRKVHGIKKVNRSIAGVGMTMSVDVEKR